MPVTLSQAKVGMADKIDQAVIDEFRRSSILLDKMIFDDTVSPGTGGSTLSYGYTRLKTPSTAQGRELNSEYTPGEAIKEEESAKIKIFGGSFEVDRVLEDTAAQSEISFQLKEKVKAAANKFHYDVINGDSVTHGTDFDGLDKILTGTSTEYNGAESDVIMDLSDTTKIDENYNQFLDMMDQFIALFEGKPTMLFMNSKMHTKMKSIARRAGYYSRTEDAFGVGVENWDGIPFIDLEMYFNGTKSIDVVPVDETTKCTSIFGVTLALDGYHGISPKGDKIIKTYLPDMKAPGAVKKGEVEMLAGTVLKKSRKAGVFRKIKVM